ncbi:cobalamin-binding protein [Nodosilinea sp. P-1105]|uniref:cobalamin-binding protein n=1 Tax=Nodosilinea sp. P-1105 TaxID=2546229 RepID=UPI00146C199F|nr:cobalamin-binding protein [Nodosilinea sp. P-1105]NMF85993.1 cobalamin-binding protein [Nodosilinea sp. P-1105]
MNIADSASHPLRIVSLIPSATEMVDALGLGDCLVGRSHECDYPPAVKSLPVCTAPKFDPVGDSATIHQRVTDLLTSALSVYRVNLEVLEALRPTHILTQAQCEVCAVNLADVEAAAAQLTGSQPQIISLEPNCLADVWADIERVSLALGGQQTAAVVAGLQGRVQACATQAAACEPKPTVACIEWIEPLMAAGNWVPELVQMAGGTALFGTPGQHSPWMSWEDLIAVDPEIIVIMPCGYDLAVTRREAQTLTHHSAWSILKAVRQEQVYLVDGNQYFNRPGPRLVESLEILAEIFHPEAFGTGHQSQGWELWPLEVAA